MKDFLSLHGRISRSNFRALSILIFGLSIVIFFLPGLLVEMRKLLKRRISNSMTNLDIELAQQIAPNIYLVGYIVIALFFMILAIKRIRDTGRPSWMLFFPIYNFKILYFELSKE